MLQTKYIPPPSKMPGVTFHFRPNKNILGFAVGRAKGIVIRPVIKKLKKPNSANRKCVIVRLPSGKEAIAYVPGKIFTNFYRRIQVESE